MRNYSEGHRRGRRPLENSAGMLCICWTVIACLTGYGHSQEPSAPTALYSESAVERELAGGETHVYRITLQAGQFVHVVADQHSLDLILVLLDPEGNQVTRVNNYAVHEREHVSFVTEKGGDYLLKVNAARPNAVKSPYTIRITDMRPTEDRDARSVATERKVAEACLLWRSGEPGSVQKASGMFSGALAEYRTLGDRRAEAEALTFLGGISVQSTRYREALDHHRQALPLLRELGARRLEGFVLNDIGYAYQNLGEFQLALDYYNQALPIRESLGLAREQAQTLTNMAVVYTQMGEAEQALAAYRRSLPLARESGDKVQEAYALNSLALLQTRLGESQGAIDILREALPLWQEAGHRNGEADALNVLGMTYKNLGDSELALDYFAQALPLWEATGNLTGAAQTLNNMGTACHYLGDSQQGLAHYERALALFREIGNRREEAAVLNNIGLTHLNISDLKNALAAFNLALEISPGGNTRSRCDALNNIGFTHVLKKEPDKALALYRQALDMAKKLNDKHAEALSLSGLSTIHSDLDQDDLARKEIEAAIAISESLRAETASFGQRALLQARYHGIYNAHTYVLMRLHENDPTKGYDSLAFTASEYARARGLLDSLTLVREETRQGVDPRLLSLEKGLRLKIEVREAERLRLLGAQQKQKLAAVDKEINELLLQKEQIEARIRKGSPEYAALMNGARPDLAEIQRTLDHETLLLEYFVGASSHRASFLWLVSRDSFRSFLLPNGTVIKNEARRVYDSLAERNRQITGESLESKRARLTKADAVYAEASARLSEMLLGPVAGQLGKKRLLIVSDGVLQYIPFAALPVVSSHQSAVSKQTESAEHRPLIADHEVVSLPSASVLIQLRQRAAKRAPAPKTMAVFADPVFRSDDERVREIADERNRSKPAENRKTPLTTVLARNTEVQRSARDAGVSNFVRLRFSRQEAEAISSLVPEHLRRTSMDFAATRQAVLTEPLDQYRILHFATHGLVNSATPALSGLVLSLVDEQGQSRNGFLRLHEIYNLKLNAELVVLSACQTALGKEVRGEGLIGLTRGFQYAGAPRVVASLWRIDDQATSELMKRFYKGMLRDGLRPAAALRAAQLSLAREARWSNPHYWAAFTLQGDWK